MFTHVSVYRITVFFVPQRKQGTPGPKNPVSVIPPPSWFAIFFAHHIVGSETRSQEMSTSPSPPSSANRMRLRVDIGKDPVSSRRLLVPVDCSSTVAELTRCVPQWVKKKRLLFGLVPKKKKQVPRLGRSVRASLFPRARKVARNSRESGRMNAPPPSPRSRGILFSIVPGAVGFPPPRFVSALFFFRMWDSSLLAVRLARLTKKNELVRALCLLLIYKSSGTTGQAIEDRACAHREREGRRAIGCETHRGVCRSPARAVVENRPPPASFARFCIRWLWSVRGRDREPRKKLVLSFFFFLAHRRTFR